MANFSRILMASSNYWDSPFQVGSHHLARGFARAGWQVGFISDPISPWHLAGGFNKDLRKRLAIYFKGGRFDLDGRIWAYVPGALATPHNKPLLRSRLIARHWHRWSMPSIVGKAKANGFGSVDLLYLDTPSQFFWLNAIAYKQAVYRVADYNPHFDKYTQAFAEIEREVAARVDLVVYPSHQLRGYVEHLNPKRFALLANGVDFDHFAKAPMPLPPEYEFLRGPIAVYVGVMPYWFHFDWVRYAACQLPDVQFVLIGPADLAQKHLRGLDNVHILGIRDYAILPAYLHHARVGLMPFDLARNPAGVNVLNPQKLYAYLASGIPVVGSYWKELERLRSPARICKTAGEFAAAIRDSLSAPGTSAESSRKYAAAFDWKNRVATLVEMLRSVGHKPVSRESA